MTLSVTEALQSRRSVRAFLDRPVPAGLLRELLTAAARAPSGGNLQPWRLYALANAPLAALTEAMTARLSTKPQPDVPEYPIYPAQIPEPYKSERSRLSESMYNAVGIPRENMMGRLQFMAGNFRFWGAPVGLFCYVERGFGAAQWSDLGMYLQSLMLLLREHGLDSCPQEAWSMYHSVVRAELQAPENLMLFCGLSIGYADPAAPINSLRSERLPLGQFAELRGF